MQKNNSKIWVIDSDEIINREIEEYFSDKNQECWSVCSLEHFNALAKKSANHILIADMQLLSEQQGEWLKFLKTKYPMLYTVMLAQPGELDSFLKCLQMGVDACVVKPFIDFVDLDIAVSQGRQKQVYWEKKLKEYQNKRLSKHADASSVWEWPTLVYGQL